MDKLSKQQRHDKTAIKQEQSDVGISSAEREQARRSANMAAIHSKDTKPERILCRAKRQSRAVRRGLWARGKSTEGQLWTTKREETLESIAFTLNHIWLQDRRCKTDDGRGKRDEEPIAMPIAAEEEI